MGGVLGVFASAHCDTDGLYAAEGIVSDVQHVVQQVGLVLLSDCSLVDEARGGVLPRQQLPLLRR